MDTDEREPCHACGRATLLASLRLGVPVCGSRCRDVAAQRIGPLHGDKRQRTDDDSDAYSSSVESDGDESDTDSDGGAFVDRYVRKTRPELPPPPSLGPMPAVASSSSQAAPSPAPMLAVVSSSSPAPAGQLIVYPPLPFANIDPRTMPTPPGARRKSVLEYTAPNGRFAWVTHDALPEELSGADVVRELRALKPLSKSEQGITPGGKPYDKGERRRTLQVSVTGKVYKYRGSTATPEDVQRFSQHPKLEYLRKEIGRLTNAEYNTLLINYYNEAGDLGWHDDGERGHVPDGKIASFSINTGPAWAFDVRRKTTSGLAPEWRIMIKSGDLVVMGGACQTLMKHRVPKQTRPEDTWRINLTFRQFTG